MDYLKPVLGTANFYPIVSSKITSDTNFDIQNVNSIIPDGIVRERRQFFVSNDMNMTNVNGDSQKFEGIIENLTPLKKHILKLQVTLIKVVWIFTRQEIIETKYIQRSTPEHQ